MLFKFGKVTANIDVEATRAYYKEHGMANDCECYGCENFRKYLENFDDKIKEFFRSIGIDDMVYIADIMAIGASRITYEKDHCILYMGFYHVVGELVGRKLFGRKRVKEIKTWEAITETFKVGISQGIGLLREGFPTPVLQIQFMATSVPWVLEEEKNQYVDR